MISRFVNLFKKDDPDEQRAFQNRVVALLKELYPERSFQPGSDPNVIEVDESQMGLTNVRSTFLLGSQTDEQLRAIVTDHFGKALDSNIMSERVNITWEQAKSQLMPQLMPEEFLEKVPLVSEPFGDRVVSAFVLDTEQTYSYVSPADIERWEVDIAEVRAQALEKLIERSQGMGVTAIPGDNPFLMIKTMDGFDAARILSPELRSFFEQHLGRPFYFGVPNRDFLICWSFGCDTEFQSNLRRQISTDFDEQPYPLSSNVFIVDNDDEISLVEADEPDPRAADAYTN